MAKKKVTKKVAPKVKHVSALDIANAMPWSGMTRARLAKEVALLEGGASEARIGDIRQILKLLCVLDAAYKIRFEHSIVTIGNVVGCLDADSMELHKKALQRIGKK